MPPEEVTEEVVEEEALEQGAVSRRRDLSVGRLGPAELICCVCVCVCVFVSTGRGGGRGGFQQSYGPPDTVQGSLLLPCP
jgi:hypothetical protein